MSGAIVDADYANGGNARNALEKFCQETGCKPKTAAEYPDQAIGIRARQTEVVVDWDENDTEITEDILPSRMGDLCYVLWVSQSACSPIEQPL